MKNKKILKTIVIILLLFIIIFGIYIIRNYIILKKISKLSEQTNTYSFVSKYHQEFEDDTNSDTTFECSYKDGISKIIIKDDDGNDYCIEWYNKNTDEYINVFPKSMTYNNIATKNSGIITTNVAYPFLDSPHKNILYTICPIRSTEINGEKSYSIYSNLAYVSAGNGRLLKFGRNGKNVIEYSNFKTEVSDEEVSKPDLTDYTYTQL